MKYILFEKSAVELLISSRFLQTSEYTEGMNFARVIRGEETELSNLPRISFQRNDEGCYFIGNEPTKTFIVIDMETSGLFQNVTLEETINIVQKLFRFSVKYWSNQGGFTSSEKILAETNKAVVFPFPYSTKNRDFRVVIERDPDSARMANRGMKQLLLVYKSGLEGAPNYVEKPSIKNFRNAVENLQTVINNAKDEFKEREKITSSDETENKPADFYEFYGLVNTNGGLPFMPFEQWDRYLTDSQKDFIYRESNSSPMRIQGPAGTGKTLSLILRAIYLLREAEKKKQSCKIIFFAHSKATQSSVENIFNLISQFKWNGSESGQAQTIDIATLHEYCIDNILMSKLSDNEILERDALDSKNLQYYAVYEAYEKVMSKSYSTYKPLLSKTLKDVLENDENKSVVCGLLQHEFSIMIKGKSGGDLERYKKVESLSAGLKTENEDDKKFIWLIYAEYQRHFEMIQQYDTDDIVLSATGSLDNPIWRRRRKQEGYDFIFIDETHLFNQNKSMVFHYLTRNTETLPIIFSIDISQAMGDQGIEEDDFLKNYVIGNIMYKKEYEIVFRCSPQITDLAVSITSSGSNLFGNFKNPYTSSKSAFTAQEEAQCKKPDYILKYSEDEMIDVALEHAEKMRTAMKCSQSEIVIISFSEILHQKLKKRAGDTKYIELTKRGDLEAKQAANQNSSFLFSLPEYVGGLEFYGVILLGVDKARVPPMSNNDVSQNYLLYTAFNQLYVSVTRAKYQVSIFGAKEFGESTCLDYALSKNTLDLTKE